MTEGLEQLKQVAQEENNHVLKEKKKSMKTDMMAQSSFAADGPALFMEGGKPVSVTLQGFTFKTKLWNQSKEIHDRPSKRSLRLCKGEIPRITSVPAGGR